VNEPIYVALGTNLGDREANLANARESLPSEMRVVQTSSIYVTPPWGYEDQPDFLNQVLETRSTLEPIPLLAHLKSIEEQMGRLKTFRNGPRLIDLDILFYGQRVVDEPELQIPHPRLQERAFVLVPLNEIAPDFIHPMLAVKVQTLLTLVDTQGVRRL